MHSFNPPNHARTFQLTAGQSVRAQSLALDTDDGQWVCRIQNTTDGNQGVISVTAIIAGLQGTESIVESLIGCGSADSFYLTGTSTIDVRAVSFNAQCSLWIEKANAWISYPDNRFTNIGTGSVVYVALSLNNGYAPPYRKYFTVYSDLAIDLQIEDENGAVLWDRLNILTTQQPVTGLLPAGCRLTGRGNAGPSTNITVAWQQTR